MQQSIFNPSLKRSLKWGVPLKRNSGTDLCVAPVADRLARSGLRCCSSSVNLLANLAKKHSVWIVGGSVSETSKDKLFNTSVVLNDTGDIVAKHRKAHLFDIDVPGKITFKESDVLTAGDKVTTFTTPWGILGKR
eukprot:GHVN01067993.1.p1 GENE.GHVN01067993.1~~GHVN01067993.1.p1  ORF type:complete len:135 (+),score=16.18 GHVN01067993.1:422-826(+)